MWFDFEDLLRKRDENDHIRLYVLAHPSEYFDKPVKISVSKLKQAAQSDLVSIEYQASSLLEQLAAASKGMLDR
jgi:hypothetical protein